MAWRELKTTGNLITWDVPKVITGVYRGSEERRKTKEDGTLIINTFHKVDLDGEEWGFFGTTLLNTALKQASPGEIVRIEYTGKQTKTQSGGRLKEFLVQADGGDGA